MAPYALYIRDDSSSSNSTDSSSSSVASSSDPNASSFMDIHGKQAYIALAVIGVLLLLIFIWAFCTHRLSFAPFNQKRCSKCGHQIPKSAKLDDDYFENDNNGKKGGGYVCRKCQEDKENEELEEELESEGLGRKGLNKSKNPGTEYAERKGRKKNKKMKVWEDDEEDHNYSDEEKQVGTQMEKKPTRVKRDDISFNRSPRGENEEVERTKARTAKDDSGRNDNVRSTRRQEEERRPSRQKAKEEQHKPPVMKKREDYDVDDDYSD
ncbi:hypothetical protein I307_05707 [Cryptococcus deuterogattii 99/473]|uniref:Uncharacterized protein n=1 Tax=Cryptococcus deuterogattii Ram5 TaxID=1296110 RepID=A0A0D0T6Z5_9TREE|nr:hypothetical protein I313_02792 [Cryptococcus deuterogattii Ram5]KIY54946.1 hypothetical protein I307_05707 [Cryptococcus deuterogattii 99/473]